MDVEKISVDGFNLNVSDAKARDMISDKYDPDNGTYVVGDTCINDDILYICNTDIDTPEDFDSSKWDADTIGHYCSELKSNLIDLTTWVKSSNLTYPATAKELLVYVTVTVNSNEFVCDKYILLSALSNSNNIFISSGDRDFWLSVGLQVQATTKAIVLNSAMIGSTDYKSSAVVDVYYR